MKRPVVIAVAVAALVAASIVGWTDVRRERDFRRLIAVGDAALARDQTYLAIEAFSGAVTLKRDSMLAHLKRGDTYRRRGEYADALRDLSQATTLDPGAPRPLELLGDVTAAMGQYQGAIDYYQRSLALEDRAPQIFYKVALAHYRAGQVSDAMEPLQKALALNGKLAEAHYLLGLVLRARKRPADAVRAFTRAVSIDSTFIAAREELADLYAESGRHREAIDQLETIAALEPTRPERLVSVGLAYARLGRHDAAIVTLGRAAERNADASVVNTALGRVWLDAVGLDPSALRKAISALEPAAARAGATSETLALYGRALYLTGNSALAERILQQSVERYPIHPLAYRYLADAASRLGHTTAAREASARYERLSQAAS